MNFPFKMVPFQVLYLSFLGGVTNFETTTIWRKTPHEKKYVAVSKAQHERLCIGATLTLWTCTSRCRRLVGWFGVIWVGWVVRLKRVGDTQGLDVDEFEDVWSTVWSMLLAEDVRCDITGGGKTLVDHRKWVGIRGLDANPQKIPKML